MYRKERSLISRQTPLGHFLSVQLALLYRPLFTSIQFYSTQSVFKHRA
jgi:hypothetical protein